MRVVSSGNRPLRAVVRADRGFAAGRELITPLGLRAIQALEKKMAVRVLELAGP